MIEEEPLFNPDDLEAVAKAKKADTIKMAELFADYAERIYGIIPEKPVAAKADTAEPAKPAEGSRCQTEVTNHSDTICRDSIAIR